MAAVRGGSPDVVVIGGGIAGVSVAAELAEAGRRVVLVERAAIASAASGRNSGVVQHPFDPVLIDLHLATVARYRALAEASSGTFVIGAEPAGMLFVSHDTETVRRIAVELRRSHPGLGAQALEPGRAREIEPALGPDVAACRLEIGYPVEPAAATRAYADLAVTRGVEIRLGLGAVPDLDAGRVVGARLGDGTCIAASDVVVAAGPWSPSLVDPSGRWRPIRPVWGVVVSMTLAVPPRHVLEEAEIDIEPEDDRTPGPEAGRSTDTERSDFSLVPAGRSSSLGSTFLDTDVAPDPAAWVPRLVGHGARFVRGIATGIVGPSRVCARPLSADGRPLVGRVPGIDGLWVLAGHGPWGISTGPGSAALLADLMTGRRSVAPPALDPARFGPI